MTIFSHSSTLTDAGGAAAAGSGGKKPSAPTMGTQLSLPKVGSLPREMGREGSHADVSKVSMSDEERLHVVVLGQLHGVSVMFPSSL